MFTSPPILPQFDRLWVIFILPLHLTPDLAHSAGVTRLLLLRFGRGLDTGSSRVGGGLARLGMGTGAGLGEEDVFRVEGGARGGYAAVAAVVVWVGSRGARVVVVHPQSNAWCEYRPKMPPYRAISPDDRLPTSECPE